MCESIQLLYKKKKSNLNLMKKNGFSITTSIWQKKNKKKSIPGTLHSQPLGCQPGIFIPPTVAHLAASHVSVGSVITRTAAVSASQPSTIQTASPNNEPVSCHDLEGGGCCW